MEDEELLAPEEEENIEIVLESSTGALAAVASVLRDAVSEPSLGGRATIPPSSKRSLDKLKLLVLPSFLSSSEDLGSVAEDCDASECWTSIPSASLCPPSKESSSC